MSEDDELMRELEAVTAALEGKVKGLNERKAARRDQYLEKAEEKTFTAKEIANLKAVFGRFDKDKSDSISLEELQLIAKELGTVMSDADAKAAMEELDVNKDGTLNFEEFVKWWASDSKRGGNKGLLLDLVKAKIMAEMVQKQVAALMRDVATKPIEVGSAQLDVHLDSVFGDVSSGVFPSNVSAYILPSTRALVEGEFLKAGVMAPEGTGPAACVTVDFGATASATELALKDAASTLNSVLQEMKEMAPIPLEVSLRYIPEDP